MRAIQESWRARRAPKCGWQHPYQVVTMVGRVLPDRKRLVVLFVWPVEHPEDLLTNSGGVVHIWPVSPSFLSPTPSYSKRAHLLLGRGQSRSGVNLTQALPLGFILALPTAVSVSCGAQVSFSENGEQGRDFVLGI